MLTTKTKIIKKKVTETFEHTFTIEDLLHALTKPMQQTLASWYKLYNEDSASFISSLNDVQEINNYILKQKMMTKKVASSLHDEFLSFFSGFTVTQFLQECNALYKFAPYDVSDGHFRIAANFAHHDKGVVSYTCYKDDTKSLHMSVQSFLLSCLFGAELQHKLSKHVFTQYIDLQYGSLFETHNKTIKHMDVEALFTHYDATTATCLYYMFSHQLLRILHDEFHEHAAFEEIVLFHHAQQAAMIGNFERNIGVTKLQQVQLQLQNVRKALADKDAKLEKQRSETKKQKELLKDARSAQKAMPTIVSNKAEIQKLEEKIKSLQSELKTAEKRFTMELKTAKSDVRKEKSQVEELKTERAALVQQLNDQKKVSTNASIMTIAKWMEVGKPLLEMATAEEEAQLEQFFTMFTQLWTDRRSHERPQVTMNDLFGYCDVRDDAHYIVLANGEAHIIEKIPAPIYLRNHQFVRVTENMEFLHSYYYCYDDAPLTQGAQFSIVEMLHEQPHVYADGKLVPLRLKTDERALDGQIVAYTRTLELARYYMEKKSNLDDLAASIQLKKHELYYVQQIIGDGAVVVQPFTQQVLYKQLPAQHNLNVFDTFTCDGETILHVFRRHAFYESSSYYTKRQLATIEDVTGPCFVRKENRELVILTYDATYYTPIIGEVIYVDEHHRYLYKVDSEGNREETLEQKLSRSNLYEPKKEKVVFSRGEEPTYKPAVTVVTRIDFFDTYKNRLTPYYDVTLVDGFGPLEKITQAARKGEVVVLCTRHMSHTTRDKVYENISRNKVLEDDSIGAQGIELRLRSYFN